MKKKKKKKKEKKKINRDNMIYYSSKEPFNFKMIYYSSKEPFNFKTFKTIRSLGENIYSGKIKMNEADQEQNPRVTAFTVSEILRENQQGGGGGGGRLNYPPHRLGLICCFGFVTHG